MMRCIMRGWFCNTPLVPILLCARSLICQTITAHCFFPKSESHTTCKQDVFQTCVIHITIRAHFGSLRPLHVPGHAAPCLSGICQWARWRGLQGWHLLLFSCIVGAGDRPVGECPEDMGLRSRIHVGLVGRHVYGTEMRRFVSERHLVLNILLENPPNHFISMPT